MDILRIYLVEFGMTMHCCCDLFSENKCKKCIWSSPHWLHVGVV